MREKIPNKTKAVVAKILAANRTVVIFGAGVAGEALFHACNDAGINVAYFCDNNSNKTERELYGVPVIHTLKVSELVKEPVFLISAADIADVIEQLKSLGFNEWYDCIELLNNFDVNRHSLSAPPDFAEFVVSTGSMCHQAFRNPEALFMRSVDLVITERCSLRCQDCANLMQYYKTPKNYPLDDILNSIKSLSEIVDMVNEVRVIGGEPLMNPDFHVIIKKLIADPKFRHIIIYTNGTISPQKKKLSHLQDTKVLFLITDYGKLSRNIKSLTKKLQQLGIQHFVQPVQDWSACGSIHFHKRGENEKYALFNGCCSKHITTLMNGTLYRCPFSANATTLGAVPHNLEDEVSIPERSEDKQKMKTVRENALKLLSKKHPLKACDYCAGRPYGAAEIEPAIQVSSPLEYDNYDEC